MKTEIKRFCEIFLQRLEAVPPALRKAAEHMEQSREPALLQPTLVTLNDLRARLRSLTDKLGNQQAYLLIFGPLKSGKSTLMNAISSAYVSEVTSLPGYPCLVYVQDAEQPHFSVTRYNGRESVFANGRVLKDVIADSHIALAQQIRETEQRGLDFDPGTHFSEAIRRIDIKVPVPSLAESSTVLVDTPGLYSRMNFGYDVLTREFRDSASCAVFVVKTDNLFLEQVFEEFNQLLDLFSRIFLVINVDSSKRDLQPDGSLQPSAESQDPAKIIDAFKTLSMAGPLRQAYEAGRLRLHAVDLLNAASAFLSQNGADSSAQRQKEAFNNFQRDLTDYLNSSDYSREFIGDSLRQGRTICEEVQAVGANETFDELRAQQETLTQQMAKLDERLATVDRLITVDWRGTLEKIEKENASANERANLAKAAQATRDLTEALDRWYASNDSVQALVNKYWDPILTEVGVTLSEDTRSRLQNLTGNAFGGAEPTAAVTTDLHDVSFSLAPSAQSAATKLQETEPTAPYTATIDAEQIPVKKSFGDWILFRSLTSVRRRVFGEQLDLEIPAEVKQKRLPDTSREALVKIIEQIVKDRFPALPTKYSDRLFNAYREHFFTEVKGGLQRLRDSVENERSARRAPFDSNARILSAVNELSEEASQVISSLNELAQQEGVTLPPSKVNEAPAPAASTDPAEDPTLEPVGV